MPPEYATPGIITEKTDVWVAYIRGQSLLLTVKASNEFPVKTCLTVKASSEVQFPWIGGVNPSQHGF